jgi:hypothetical protein
MFGVLGKTALFSLLVVVAVLARNFIFGKTAG